MRDWLLRLRAVVTPQAAFLLAAILLAFSVAAGSGGDPSLEKRISQTLSAMEGAGRVEVTIRMRQSAQTSGTFNSEEIKEIPAGAVAVVQGANDPLVAMEIREALCALLGLPASSVSIVTGGK